MGDIVMTSEDSAMPHQWELDRSRTRLEISVLVYRCRTCGCLQIKNGGPDAPGVYKPNDPAWNPFRTLSAEPPCGARVPAETSV